MPSLLASPQLSSAVTVAIVRDPAAADYHGNPAALDTIVMAWERMLRSIGARVHVIEPAALARGATFRVLVVPSSPCLTVGTRAALERAAALGQGVIATGRIGTYDARCRPIGYGLVVALSGARRADTLEKRDMAYVRFSRETPLAAGMPPGARLELDPAGHVALRHPARDAYYSDFNLDPRPARGERLLDGAASHATYGNGRVVYWGFEVTDVSKLPWNVAILALLMRNSVAWAAKQPLIEVEAWPHGAVAAAAIVQDVEDQFANAKYAMDSLHAANVPATYFLTSRLARRYAQLTRALAQHGEVGTHSENHRLLGGSLPDSQAARLALTQRELTALVGHPVRGLRPPEEQFDSATMSGWLKAGGRYIFGANNSRSAAPELLAIGDDTLVLLGRVNTDDFNATSLARGDRVEGIAREYLSDFDRVRALGGLYLMSFHSQLLARSELVPALARVARRLRRDPGIWLATTGEIAEWWRMRARVDVHVQRDGAQRMLIKVTNHNSDALRGAVVRVTLHAPLRGAKGSASLLPAKPGVLRVRLASLRPHETRTVAVALARSDARAARAR